jgi:copper chaperone CopZ
MIKTTLRIDGMMCGMCEAHVNDAIRARFNVKKVTSSHAKGECVILSEEALDETALRAAIAGTGYELKSLNSEEYKKKGSSACSEAKENNRRPYSDPPE